MTSIWDELRHVRQVYHVRGCDSLSMRPARADRRTHPRYDTPGLRGTVWFSGREADVDVLDLSLSGANVRGELRTLTEDHDAVLAMHIERRRPIIVACEVVRADYPDFGFRFMALDPIQVHSLFFYMYGLNSKYGVANVESMSGTGCADALELVR